MKKQKAINTIIICLAIGLFVSYTAYSFKLVTRSQKLPVLGQVDGFILNDSNGEPFSSDRLKGKVWIADFIFTTCSGICPIMSKHMASLNRSFKLTNGIEFVSISVNPEHDTPDVLRKYIEKLGIETEKWHFLTGSREDIKDLTLNSFKLGSIEEPIFHSAYFPLVDRNGYIRGYYEGTNKLEINRLFKDAAKLSLERY